MERPIRWGLLLLTLKNIEKATHETKFGTPLVLTLLSSVFISRDLKLIHDFLYTFTNQRLFVLLINEMEIGFRKKAAIIRVERCVAGVNVPSFQTRQRNVKTLTDKRASKC